MKLNTAIIWSFIFIACAMLYVDIPLFIMPFIIAFILAYALNPLMNTLSTNFGFSVTLSAALTLLGFLVIFAFLLVMMLPVISSQISLLIEQIPTYQAYINQRLIPAILKKLYSVDPRIAEGLKNGLAQSVDDIFVFCASTMNNLWIYTKATIHVIVMSFIMPVILFYFLRDWDKMQNSFYDMFPKTSQKFVRSIFKDISSIMSSYVRGQLLVCLIWTIYYYIALRIIGIDLALILAIASGIAPMIPIVGTIIAVGASLVVGIFTFGFSVDLAYIGAVYTIGTLVDNAVVTPKILGDSIGLSPIWIMLAVFILGYILGPVGMLIATPVAGIVSVILKYARHDYKKSGIYNK